MSTILIENGTVLTVDDAGTLYEPGYVLVQDDRILIVGAGTAPEELQGRLREATWIAAPFAATLLILATADGLLHAAGALADPEPELAG